MHERDEQLRVAKSELAARDELLARLDAIGRSRSRRWRSFTQFCSWLFPPTTRHLGYIRTYLQLRRSDLFDADYYLSRYPDVLHAGLNPLMHYVEHGHREGRQARGSLELSLLETSPPSSVESPTLMPPLAPELVPEKPERPPEDVAPEEAFAAELGDALAEHVPETAVIAVATGGEQHLTSLRGVQDSSLPSGLRWHARKQRCDGRHRADRQPRGDPRRRCRVPVGAGEPAVVTRAQPPVPQAPGRSLLASTRLGGAWSLLRAPLARHEQAVAPTALRSRGVDRTRDQPRSLDPGLEQRASARGRAAWMRRVYVPRAGTSPPRRKRRRGRGRPVVQKRLAEATRVARHGVLEVPDDGTSPRLNASAAFFTHAPTVSIVIPCHEQIAHTQACIHALEETIPTWFRGEILIVDDASSPSTVADLHGSRTLIHT